VRVVEAEFLSSGAAPEAGAGWPAEGPLEVAFAGRSNVGKSTLLNALMGRRGLVRVSSTPGRTRLINFFRVVVSQEKGKAPPTELRFVDLPGFGYAKVSKEERATWRPFVERYFGHRKVLRCCVLLCDARRGPELDETELATWLTDLGIEVIPVMTKADKLAKHERQPAAQRMRAALGRPVIVVSATSGEGVPELWHRLLGAVGTPRE
jgi:GTP-binding protein